MSDLTISSHIMRGATLVHEVPAGCMVQLMHGHACALVYGPDVGPYFVYPDGRVEGVSFDVGEAAQE